MNTATQLFGESIYKGHRSFTSSLSSVPSTTSLPSFSREVRTCTLTHCKVILLAPNDHLSGYNNYFYYAHIYLTISYSQYNYDFPTVVVCAVEIHFMGYSK